MADIEKEKIKLRQQIISAANVYKENLAGKVFLYVYGNQYFEVAYMTRCFKHLTGVESPLRGDSFYNNAKESKLAAKQISFSKNHPLKNAKKKGVCLQQLPRLTNELVCVVKDMNTLSISYKLGITNLEFTVGLTENLDIQGNLVNNWLLPRTLRINDKSLEHSTDAQFVEFIFAKKATDPLYHEVCYAEEGVAIPKTVLSLLDDSLKSPSQIGEMATV